MSKLSNIIANIAKSWYDYAMKKILVSALEPSANLHLEPVLKLIDDYEIRGVFDEKFGKPLYSSSDFSIMGFFDAFLKIKKAKKAITQMSKLSLKCDKVLLIDSPAFNLPLAKAIRKINPNIEIIYYILPKVWAWKEKRVAKVEKYCDKLASIFPFENKFYHKSIYVGNPLLDEIKTYKSKVTNYGATAFLPGSRKSEIKSLIGIYKKVAKEIKGKKFLVIPKHFSNEEIKELYGDIDNFTVKKDTMQALNESDFAFICSGTATLEAAIVGVPFVLVYKAKKIDYLIAKRFVKLKYVGLANIILDFEGLKPLHKELIQDEATEANLLKIYKSCNKEEFFIQSKKLKKILKHGSALEIARLLGD